MSSHAAQSEESFCAHSVSVSGSKINLIAKYDGYPLWHRNRKWQRDEGS